MILAFSGVCIVAGDVVAGDDVNSRLQLIDESIQNEGFC